MPKGNCKNAFTIASVFLLALAVFSAWQSLGAVVLGLGIWRIFVVMGFSLAFTALPDREPR